MGSETGEIIEEIFDSFLQRYKKKKLEESLKGSEFVFDSISSKKKKKKKN